MYLARVSYDITSVNQVYSQLASLSGACRVVESRALNAETGAPVSTAGTLLDRAPATLFCVVTSLVERLAAVS